MTTQNHSRTAALALMAAFTLVSASAAFGDDSKRAASSGDAHTECNEPDYTSGRASAPRGAQVRDASAAESAPAERQDRVDQAPATHHRFTITPTNPFRDSGA